MSAFGSHSRPLLLAMSGRARSFSNTGRAVFNKSTYVRQAVPKCSGLQRVGDSVKMSSRSYSCSALLQSDSKAKEKKEKKLLPEPVTFTFIEGDAEFGERIEVTVTEEGHKLVDVALDNDVDIEAACGGELACSTCHCVFPKDIYDKLPTQQVEEEDMLDLAAGLTDTSRLSCQIDVTSLLQGAEIVVPGDGF